MFYFARVLCISRAAGFGAPAARAAFKNVSVVQESILHGGESILHGGESILHGGESILHGGESILHGGESYPSEQTLLREELML